MNLGFGETFEVGVDQESGGIMLGSAIDRNSDNDVIEEYSKCNLRLFSCKTTNARADVYYQKFKARIRKI